MTHLYYKHKFSSILDGCWLFIIMCNVFKDNNIYLFLRWIILKPMAFNFPHYSPYLFIIVSVRD